MKKILITVFLSITFITTLISANEVKKTDEELMAEIFKIDKQIEVERQKQKKIKAKTKALKRLNKTTDKLLNILNIKN